MEVLNMALVSRQILVSST